MPTIPLDILAHWEKLCGQADVGPWEPIWNDQEEKDWSGKVRCGMDGTFDQTIWEPTAGTRTLNAANIRFLCSSRTAIPLLIMEIRDLRAELYKKDKDNGR